MTSRQEHACCLKLIEQNLRQEEISCDDFSEVSENEELQVEANKIRYVICCTCSMQKY